MEESNCSDYHRDIYSDLVSET